MDVFMATELAYKNGYKAAVKKFAEKVKEQNGNHFLVSWYESGDECYEFDQDKFESFIDNLVKDMLDKDAEDATMEKIVYVAYAHYIFGETSIIGVYRNPDDAKRRCKEREDECDHCDYADWEMYVIR